MRVLTLKDSVAADDLGSRVLTSKLSATKSQAALTKLQQLNPHVDFQNIQPGTVLFVPDEPDFKVSESDSIFGTVMQDLEKMIKSGLNVLVARQKEGADARLAEQTEVTNTLQSAAFQQIAAQDPAVQAQVDAATANLSKLQDADRRTQDLLGTASKNALASLKSIIPK